MKMLASVDEFAICVEFVVFSAIFNFVEILNFVEFNPKFANVRVRLCQNSQHFMKFDEICKFGVKLSCIQTDQG